VLPGCSGERTVSQGDKSPLFSPVDKEAATTTVSIHTSSPLSVPSATRTADVVEPIAATASTHAISPLATPSAAFSADGSVPVYTYRIVRSYPHDPDAYTQGLVFHQGFLYEGTGRHGFSTLRRVELESGRVLQMIEMDDRFFGEGVTIYEDKVIQLTWHSRIGFVYDTQTFELLRPFRYPTEGWGITHDGRYLIMSDGTSTLHFIDPQNYAEVARVDVYDDKGPVVRLNELEYVQGEIYANVWQTDRIARIDPKTGRVVGWIDLTGILRDADRPVDVLNGIAFDEEQQRLFVTGKLWPELYEIELVRLPAE
jgi:glutamine cyclotransferase